MHQNVLTEVSLHGYSIDGETWQRTHLVNDWKFGI